MATFALPFLCLVLSLHVVFAQDTCDQGTFRNGEGNCMPCPAGTYQRERNATSCKPCPRGWYGFIMNGIFFGNSCFPCKPGTFSRSPGSSKCNACPFGTTSGEGFFRCSACGRGMRARATRPLPDMMLTGCNMCPRGTFSNKKLNQVCTKCPPGTTASRGAKSCRKCSLGTYSNRMRVCKPCASGTFSDARGAAFCKLCPPGSFSRGRSSRCTPCPAGMFAPKVASRSSECLSCRMKRGSLGIRPAGCKNEMGLCPKGTFLARDGECKACSPGEKLDMSTMTCVSCAEDEVSFGGTHTTCEKCSENEEPVRGFGNSDGLRCSCKVGFQRADGRPPAPYEFARRTAPCIRCPPMTIGDGMSRLVTGSATRDIMRGGWEPTCAGCEEGSFPVINVEGEVTCRICPEGTIFNRMNERCEACPAGSMSVISKYRPRDDFFLEVDFTPMSSTQCLIVRTGCAVLGFRNERCAARVCPEGTFMDMGRCRSCMPGEYLSMASSPPTCKMCPAGTVSNGMDFQKCTKCSAGQIAAISECRCPRGYFLKNGKTCTKCPKGTFNPFSRMFRQDRCFPCPEGTFSTGAAAFCRPCKENEITSGTGASKCRMCLGRESQAKDLTGSFVNRCVSNDPFAQGDMGDGNY